METPPPSCCPGFCRKESLWHSMARPGPQGMRLQTTTLVCHNKVVPSSSDVAGNETVPKRENELKDWIMSPCCLWIGGDEAQRDWSPYKVVRRVWNRSHLLTCKTFFFDHTYILLFSLKHLAHNHRAAVRQSYNPGIMTQSFIWASSYKICKPVGKRSKTYRMLSIPAFALRTVNGKKYYSKFL